MGSFSKLSRFPAGYFRAASSWLLRNRRDVVSRIQVISAEVARIGFIRCLYEGVEEIDGTLIRSENRVGFAVTEGSTLARLIQAYVVLGGNPMDISPFMYPDTTDVVDVKEDGTPIIVEEFPFGGIIAPESASPESPLDEPGASGYEATRAGRSSSSLDYANRLGGRMDRGIYDFDAIVKTMHRIRSWANQDIKERLQDIEWRIIKQADLREQLIHERDEILQGAFAGSLEGLPDLFDDDRFLRGLAVQGLVQAMYELLFQTGDDGTVINFSPNVDTGFSFFIVPPTGTKPITNPQVNEIRDPLGG